MTWYIRTGTVAVPGVPVATPWTVERREAFARRITTTLLRACADEEAAFDGAECDAPPPSVAANAIAPAATNTRNRAPTPISRACRARARRSRSRARRRARS